MRMLVYSLVGLVVLAAGLYGWGLVLPEEHLVELSREIGAGPDLVFARIVDFEAASQWRRDVKSVTYDRAAQRVVETNSMGEMPYRIVRLDAPRRLETEIDGGRELGFGGTWVFEVEPMGSGSRVKITERGRVYSALFRVMGKLFFPAEKTAREYLEDLEKSFREVRSRG